MALTEAQKRKIREEEELRAQIRSEMAQPEKKKTSGFTKFLTALLIIFIGIPVLLAMLLSSLATGTSSSSNTPVDESPTEMNVKVNASNGYLNITNNEAEDLKECYFVLNDNYYFPQNWNTARLSIKAGETSSIGFNEFVDKESAMFNIYKYKPTKISGSCKGRFGYWEWN